MVERRPVSLDRDSYACHWGLLLLYNEFYVFFGAHSGVRSDAQVPFVMAADYKSGGFPKFGIPDCVSQVLRPIACRYKYLSHRFHRFVLPVEPSAKGQVRQDRQQPFPAGHLISVLAATPPGLALRSLRLQVIVNDLCE